jgi:hypothetical protein
LHGVVAGRRFGRQHDRIGAVEDGVGDVRNFGAGGRRRVDHRFHHLRCRDRQLVRSRARRIMRFCKRRHRRVTDFDREVAARDHQAVGGVENLFERGDGFDPLDLGDGQRMTAAGDHQLARHVHVGRALGEGDGKIVGADLRRRLDVVHVLGRQRWRREAAALAVDALVVRKRAAVQDDGVDFLVDDLANFEYDASVVEQQNVAGADVLGQLLVVETDALLIAEFAWRRE